MEVRHAAKGMENILLIDVNRISPDPLALEKLRGIRLYVMRVNKIGHFGDIRMERGRVGTEGTDHQIYWSETIFGSFLRLLSHSFLQYLQLEKSTFQCYNSTFNRAIISEKHS